MSYFIRNIPSYTDTAILDQKNGGGMFDYLFGLIHEWITNVVADVPSNSGLRIIIERLIQNDWERKKSRWPQAFLPLLTCQAVGGSGEVALSVTYAWNLLHMAAHILDEIEDQGHFVGPDGTMPLGEAVNLGTTLIFLAQLSLDQLPATGLPLSLIWRIRHELNRVTIQMCAGQHRDLNVKANSKLDLDSYWQVMGDKTGCFFGWAAQAGALVGEAENSQIESCYQYGYNLGLLLQVLDDWLGLDPNEGVTDLALGKKTLPVLYALSVAPIGQKETLIRSLNEACFDKAAEASAREEIIRLGGLHYTLVQAEVRRKRAETIVLGFRRSESRDCLLTLLDQAFPIRSHLHI